MYDALVVHVAHALEQLQRPEPDEALVERLVASRIQVNALLERAAVAVVHYPAHVLVVYVRGVVAHDVGVVDAQVGELEALVERVRLVDEAGGEYVLTQVDLLHRVVLGRVRVVGAHQRHFAERAVADRVRIRLGVVATPIVVDVHSL